MITLSSQLLKDLDLTYWQYKSDDSQDEVKHTITFEEKELLRKILLAKGINLSDNLIEIIDEQTVIVRLNQHQLVFKDVHIPDTQNLINLANIKQMLQSPEHKKRTWFKLKDLDLS